MLDKYAKIDRVFQGISEMNKKSLEKFESTLGREITFEEYLEKYLEDVTMISLQAYVEGYLKEKSNKN